MKGDFKHLHKSGLYDEGAAFKAWERLYNQYIEQFGVPEQYQRYLQLMVRACKLYNESYNGNKRWKVLKARITENEAKKMLEGEVENINVTAAKLSKHFGYQIDVTKTSVAQFYAYIEMIKNGK